ncbi:MAG: glycine cleavage system aminomethyltransferase GcvT [Candidatus Eremiobacteraeota bacterium]|nr:glycine cleavage system aminomethyltransferase GcvT [Candidatus Eremiobacteraeota bacterium]
MTVPQAVKKTALHGEHVALSARIVPFGGFDMPLQYAGILKEHDAVRHRAGLFDLSHMGQFVLRGPNVAEWADRLTVNNVATMKPYQARYNIFCNEQGGAHDDVIFYRLPEDWLLVVNAANAEKIWAHLQEHLPADGVVLENRHGRNALIAMQGPKSAELLRGCVHPDIAELKYYVCLKGTVYGKRAIIARTGYTGEDGFELFVDAADAPEIWKRLLEEKISGGLEPAGLGARDVLRLEAGMPLYGHELTEEIGPLAAGLNWCVKLWKPDFLGKGALERQKAEDRYLRIAGVVVQSKAPAREGYAVFANGRRVGEVRSGSVAPSIANKNIATVLVEREAATIGTTLQVEIRGTQYPAEVVAMPFYKRGNT